MERLAWVFDLIDKVSNPAKTAGSALSQLQAQLKAVQNTTGKAQGGLTGVGGSIKALDGLLKGIGNPLEAAFGPLPGISAAAGVATGAMHMLLGVVVALSVALGAGAAALVNFGIEQTKFQENTIQSFRMLSGLKGQAAQDSAEGLFQRAIQFGQYSPLDTRQSVETFQRLRSSFTQKQTETLYAGLSDLVSMSGTGDAGGKALVTALSQIKAAGSLKGQDLMQVLNVSGLAGIGRLQIGAEVAKLKKVSTEAGAQMLEGGILKSDEAIVAILNAIRTKTGAELGQYSIDQANNLGGAIINLKGRFEELFLTVRNLSDLPGIGYLKDAINGLSDALKTTSASGKSLQSAVVGAFNAILTTVAGDPLFGGDRLAQTVESAAVAFQQFGAVVQVGLSGVLGLVDGLAEGLGLGKEFMGGPFDPAKVVVLAEKFRTMGESIGSFAAMVFNFFKPIITFFDQLLSGEWLAGLNSVLKVANAIASPLSALTNFSAEGLAGIFGPAEAAPAVQNSTRTATQANNITVNMNGTAGGSDPEAAGRTVGQAVANQISSSLQMLK